MQLSASSKQNFELPPAQQAIRDKCFHPSGSLVEFPIADVESSIPRRFEKRVSQFPNQLAIKSEHCKWSYRDLDDAANRIASAIPATAEDPTGRIGVLCDNDATLVAAMLGVLKAGRAVLLLDPSISLIRSAGMLSDAQARLVICDSNNEDLANAIVGDDYHVMNCQNTDREIAKPQAAARIFAKIVDKFQIDLPLKEIFAAPTVAAMATVILENLPKRMISAELDQVLREVEALTDEDASELVSK